MRALLDKLRARPLATASVLVAVLVVLRSAPHVFFASSHFDSDMAIFGIMGLDIVRGEPLPFYTYGQQYLLALEAYMAAPLFAITGASVASLKLPLVALNVVTAIALVRNLRQGHITTRAAFLCALPFVLPSLFMARSLVAAHGCNIEPFVAIVLLFAFRDRPIVFGMIGGIFYLNREFTAYALPALVVAERIEGRRIDRQHVVRRLAACAIMALVVLAGRRIGPHGPHYFGTPAVPIGFERDPLHALGWLASDILPVVVGATDGPFPVLATSPAIPRILGAVLVVVLAFGGACTLASLRSHGWRDETTRKGLAFPTYLVTVALVSSSALVLLGGMAKDVWAVRYDYLAVLGVCGMLGAFFAAERSSSRRSVVEALVGLSSAATLVLHLAVWHDAIARGPTKERLLARWLVEHGYETGRAEYWTAYSTSFLSSEKVLLTSTGGRIPIQRYEDRFRAGGKRAEITADPCPPDAAGGRVLAWCVRDPW